MYTVSVYAFYPFSSDITHQGPMPQPPHVSGRRDPGFVGKKIPANRWLNSMGGRQKIPQALNVTPVTILEEGTLATKEYQLYLVS